jgi:hypothetical protein
MCQEHGANKADVFQYLSGEPGAFVRVLERIQTPREFRSPTGGEPAVELHEECLPVLLELRSAVLQGPRFCPHFVRWEADHQSSGNPALAILINVVQIGCFRAVLK